MTVHVFKVPMTCEGCAKAISNVLEKHKGEINKYTVNLETTTVEIDTSTLSVEQLIEILKKTGKTVEYLKEKK